MREMRNLFYNTESMNKLLIDIILRHISLHEKAEVVDVYKLLYQSANGPRHLLDYGIDLEKLMLEWNEASNFMEEPLEPISVDGKLVRAHFAPLRSKNVLFDEIVEALLATAYTYVPRNELMTQWWAELGDLVQSGIVPLCMEQFIELDKEFQQFGFIPKHHSSAFIQAYKPAYVVILRDAIASHKY